MQGFNVFKDSTRAFFVDQVGELQARGAEGVILGCTEIELLIQQEHTPDTPLFASAEIHIGEVPANHRALCLLPFFRSVCGCVCVYCCVLLCGCCWICCWDCFSLHCTPTPSALIYHVMWGAVVAAAAIAKRLAEGPAAKAP
jgi:hypothetical protein